MLTALIIIGIYFFIFFIVGTIIKNNSIVDIGWGLGYVVASWTLFVVQGTYHVPAIVMNILISMWGLRLFYYILRRNIFQAEDFRYQNWRKAWGKWVIPRAFLQVYMLQGFFMWVVGSTSYLVNTTVSNLSIWGIIGIVIWIIGYLFEVIGDAQLKQHIATKKGTLMMTGLWRITRHPNYFGESMMWFGLFVFAMFHGAPWYSIISPITMTYILYFISTPLLEQRMKQKDGWTEYSAKTPMFFPFLKGGRT